MTQAVEVTSAQAHGSHSSSRSLKALVSYLFLALTLLPLLLVTLAANGFAQAPTLTPEAERDLRLQPGVVIILVELHFQSQFVNNGEPFGCPFTGTGFLYRPDGYLITNGHVVQAANIHDILSLVKLVDKSKIMENCPQLGTYPADWTEQQKDLFNQSVKLVKFPDITVFLDNGQSFPAEIKQYSEPITDGGKDVAILKIDGQNLPTVPLGTSSDMNVGDSITVIGYPGAAHVGTNKESALIPTVTNGRISALKTDLNGKPVIQSEAIINHGNSGGPAFNAQGRAIGIATFGSEEAGFNFFVPIDTAMEFVRSAGAPPESGGFDALWSSALDAYAAQNWILAHQLLSQVLEMMPDQPDAEKLMKEASAHEAGLNGFQRGLETARTVNPVVWIGLGLVCIALVGGGLIMSRPRPAPAAARGTARGSATIVQTDAPHLPARTIVESLGSLYISSGPTKGRQYAIPRDGLRIGRDPNACTVVLPVETVGREHAWVMPMEDGQVAVIDRGSTNGTFVNSLDNGRIRKVILKAGDRIFICHENPIEIVYQRG